MHRPLHLVEHEDRRPTVMMDGFFVVWLQSYFKHAKLPVFEELRKVLKNRWHFLSDEAATKLIYLAQHHQKVEKSPGYLEVGRQPVGHSFWSEILCRGDLKNMKPKIPTARDKRWALETIGSNARLLHNGLFADRSAAATWRTCPRHSRSRPARGDYG
jgi:hypothetical protein